MTDNVTSTGQPGRLAALWSVLANWRDWNLPVKLAAVTLVPVIFAIVLGAMQISDQIDKAGAYRRVDRLVVVDSELRSLIRSLQRERTAGVVLLAARAADIGPRTAQERAASDAARAGFSLAAGRVTLDEAVTAGAYADVRKRLAELPGIRAQVLDRKIDPSTARERYTDVVDALLRFDRAMTAEALDPKLAATASALNELEVVREQVALQHALIGAGIVRGGLAAPDLEALRNSARRLADSTTDFYAVAGAERQRAYDDKVSGSGIADRNTIVSNVLAARPGADIPAGAQEWHDASTLTEDRIGDVSASLGRQLRDRSAALQDKASDGAGLAAVILLLALVVAIAVMFVVGRHLLSSLSALRRSALEVAEYRLPDAVARIRDRGDDAGPVAVEPVPVTSMDEVGQVARAFDAVQRQALKLATEQAGLRAKYASVFVNLSRRSQGLVQRQLQLLERLERDEEDADQLATLFQLDHLATRMRRNNENLMVLSGSEVGRRNQKPTSLADLLRAAVSEIEQYQRVVMLPPPSVRIVGYAVGDIVRLTAELLDNATAFSAPDTQVTIASHLFEDGSVCVAVLDEGIGMSQEELDEANAKLVDSGSIDVSTSRRMGLFVIGRLASRHGIEVRLGVGHDVTGVRATVTVPADLVTPADAGPGRAKAKAGTSSPASALTAFSPNGMPKVNGHTNGSAVNGTNGHPPAFKPSSLERRGSDVDKSTEQPPPEKSTPDTGDEHGPLPRRSPGARMPGPASPSGLFAPVPPGGQDTSWWTTARESTGPGRPVDSQALGETTPIFDEMVSAWFRTIADQPPAPEPPAATPKSTPDGASPPGEQPRPDDGWRFAADSGFDVARAVSRAEPEAFTEHGLPRRNAGQRLVPGSAGGAAEPDSGLPRRGRDADDVRERLSDYRLGVRRARHHRQAHAGGDGADAALGAGTDAATSAATGAGTDATTGAGAGAGTNAGTAPGINAVTEAVTEAGTGSAPGAGTDIAPEAETGAGTDAATDAAIDAESGGGTGGALNAVSDARINAVTGAGTDATTGARTGVGADAATNGTATNAATSAEINAGAAPGTEAEIPPVVQPRSPDQVDLTGAGWRFAADIGWRAANDVSTATPVDFTSGGLPRRSAGQHLVPGSVAAAGGGPLRTDRAGRAEELRGRLDSFQQGLARGRRSLAERGTANGHPENKQQESE